MDAVATPAPPSEARHSGFEWVMTVFVLFVFTGAIVGVLDGHHAETGRGFDPGILLKLTLGIAYAFSLYVTVRDRAFIPSAKRTDIWICLLVLLAIVSTVWSDLPSRTFARSIQLVLTTWFAAYMARSFSQEEQIALLQQALLAVMVCSLVAGSLFPDYGIMHGGEFEGAWRGAFIHKNYLGRICFLGLLAFGTGWRVLPQRRLLAGTGLFASLLLLALSTSRTAMVSFALVLLLLPLFRSMRQRGMGLAIYLTAALLAVSGTCWWVYTHLDDVMQLLGRNLTLSGRTALWFAVVTFIGRRPFLGYGYSAFWQGMAGNSGYISMALHWEVPHAHNGLLDLALDAGLLGVGLFLMSFFGVLRRAIGTLRTASNTGIAMWPLLVLTFMFLSNTAESSLIRFANTFWVLYVVVALTDERQTPVAVVDA